LAEIDKRYGVHATAQHSLRVEKLAQIGAMMRALRANPPRELAGEAVTITDLRKGGDLPPTDGVEFTGDTVHVVVRPSGTEPKLKCYCEARRSAEEAGRNLVASRAAAAHTLDELWNQIHRVLQPSV